MTDEIHFCISRQNLWASRFVTVLLGNTQFMSCLMHRIWDLLRNQVFEPTSWYTCRYRRPIFCFPFAWLLVNHFSFLINASVIQGSLLSGSQLLGLAAFVVHLHASASPRLLVQLVPPISAGLVNFGDAFVLALECNTQTNMVFCVRWGERFQPTRLRSADCFTPFTLLCRFCLLAVCYGLCRGDSVPRQQQQDYVLSSFYKKVRPLVTFSIKMSSVPP